MAIAVNAIRVAISEVLEGDLGTVHPVAGTFQRGAFEGQPDDAKLAKLRQTSTALHWFDVVVGTEEDHDATPISTRAGHRRHVTLPITVEVWTAHATEAQESDRAAIIADVSSDLEDACQALAYPGTLDETVDETATGIVSGVMRGSDHTGVAAFELVAERWDPAGSWIHSRITGAVIVAEAA